MKLQYHKIRGVDKSVCTAEQKIAYNMASRIYGDIRFAKAWQQYDSGKVPAFLQNDWESKAIREYFTTWQRDYNKASVRGLDRLPKDQSTQKAAENENRSKAQCL